MIGCIATLSSCKKNAQTTTAGAAAASTYPITVVQLENRELSESYSATIRGRQDIDIYPQVSGTIVKLNVSEGDKVRAGEILFVIDQVPYQAALNTALANVEAAKAGLATAELNYESNKELYAEKVISEFTLKTSENDYLTAKAQLSQAEAAEVDARNNLSYTEVKSPSDGVIGTLPYRIGALVSSAMAQPLTTVSDYNEMYVYFSMSENQLLNLIRQHGGLEEAVKDMLDVTLTLSDGSEYSEKGKIESISGVIDRQTGAATLRAVFPNPTHTLHSGMSGAVNLPYVYEDCIVIPQAATVQMQDQTLIYKVVDGKAVSALVQVAPISNGQEYIVTGGLTAGEKIISDGAGLMREGTQVE